MCVEETAAGEVCPVLLVHEYRGVEELDRNDSNNVGHYGRVVAVESVVEMGECIETDILPKVLEGEKIVEMNGCSLECSLRKDLGVEGVDINDCTLDGYLQRDHEVHIVEMKRRTRDDIQLDLWVEIVELDECTQDRILPKDPWVEIETVEMHNRTGDDIPQELWVEIVEVDECTRDDIPSRDL